MKLEFSRQIFENYTDINFMNIRLVGIEFFRADRHEEANSRFSQFRERAKQTVRVQKWV
jgi:hypothetical protein